MKEAKLNDFGAKIGGARKDLYNFEEFTEEEKLKLVKKDAIWKKPDYEKLIEEGLDDGVAYYMNLVRKSITPKPKDYSDETIENYIHTVTAIRDDVMKLKTKEDIEEFSREGFYLMYTNKYRYSFVFCEEAEAAMSRRTWKAVMTSYGRCKRMATRELFGVPESKKPVEKIRRNMRVVNVNGTTISINTAFEKSHCLEYKTGLSVHYFYLDNHEPISDKIHVGDFVILNTLTGRIILSEDGKAFITREDAESALNAMIKEAQESVENGDATVKKTRKGQFKSICVLNVTRSGALDYTAGTDVNGEDYMSTFGFRGGEFGHWMNDKDRQDSMNYGFNALMDLAFLLNIQAESISLGKSLAIAFGARGKGSASAHFEPLRNVINLTKMSGAGCLAHEWCHALDFYIGKKCGTKVGSLASDRVMDYSDRQKVPEAFLDLVNSLKKTEGGDSTNYYKGSVEFGRTYAKTGHGYWESNCEMLARAFDCYIHDKLTDCGMRSDYLSANSESFKVGDVIAYPVGDERKVINEKFDRFFDHLREEGF